MKMKLLQILLLGALLYIFSIKCQPFATFKSNNDLLAGIGADKKSSAKIEGGNGVNTYAAYNVRKKRYSLGSGCQRTLSWCKKDEECCTKKCHYIRRYDGYICVRS